MATRKNVSPFFKEVIELENVVGVGRGAKLVRGIATRKDAVVILVQRKLDKSELLRKSLIPRKINGLLTDVVEVGDVKLFEDEDIRTKFVRPAHPGLSIGHFKVSAGTFGAIVRDRANGNLLMLSNNHVFANLSNGIDGRSNIGDIILQPGLYDGGGDEKSVIGYLEKFIPVYRELMEPQCKIAKFVENVINKLIGCFRPEYQVQMYRNNEFANIVDCAVARPVSSVQITPEIIEIGNVVGVKEPEVGMAIKKSGRSTGLTHGSVLAVDVTIKVNVGHREYSVFTDQILAGPMSMPGDSGSLILTEDNYAVGLLFAGSEKVTMFNKISNVMETLNITF